MLRECTQCGVIAHTEEELIDFVRQARGKHGYRNLCKKYHGVSESYGARYDIDYYYDKRLKSTYNITINDYNIMFKTQNGSCKICNTHQSELKSRLYVDHCHTTNKIRGLLCQHCNTLLGYAKDNVETLSLAIQYLNKHKEK